MLYNNNITISAKEIKTNNYTYLPIFYNANVLMVFKQMFFFSLGFQIEAIRYDKIIVDLIRTCTQNMPIVYNELITA